MIWDWRLKYSEYKYRKKYNQTLKQFDSEEIHHNNPLEVQLAFEQWMDARSDLMIYKCNKNGVPIPTKVEYGEREPKGSYWTISENFVLLSYLNNDGLFELEKILHDVKSRRFESRAKWVRLLGTFLSIVTGLVGAFIGLISIWPAS